MNRIDALQSNQYWALYWQIFEHLKKASFPHGQMRCSRMLEKMRKSKEWQNIGVVQ